MFLRVRSYVLVRARTCSCARASCNELARTERVDVCEECKVRGRRGSKRVNRALRHSRRKEVMCNNARPMCMHCDRFLIIIAKEPDRFRTKSRRTLPHVARARTINLSDTFMYLFCINGDFGARERYFLESSVSKKAIAFKFIIKP
ncbi:hypothetical protein ALC57_14905 [Trachymyrmex cornetzi]|uniref:Uncharacterized protein n=1 Tax=Trachymyrmex cornetzi TaxID=471704 RepID=A0A195DIY6_9HYME|nr:hypothetical protein ALC57_14905 [Trachymyrmex cornetzi]